ncbi:MAG TPA: carbohydrate ABC transporter permease [Trueperaceae bacterium]
MNAKTTRSLLLHAVLLGYVVIIVFPILWTLGTSFKDNAAVFQLPPIWFPEPDLSSYVRVLQNSSFVGNIVNSLVVSTWVTLVCVALGVPAAYGFSRLPQRGSNVIFNVIIGSRLVPPVSFIIPFLIIFSQLKLLDTRTGLVIANVFFSLPFAIWVLRGFFDSIPKELMEASKVDGCDNPRTFWLVALPLARPGIVAAAILSFLFSWNEFMFALTLTRTEAKTLPVGLTDFFRDDIIVWNQLAAATVIAVIPAVLFVFVFQRHLIRGMLSGSVKG